MPASFARNAKQNLSNANCTVSRKDKGISIFKTSLTNNEFNKKWSQDLFNIILKYRRRDKSLNERFKSHKFFICKKILLGTRYMLVNQ